MKRLIPIPLLLCACGAEPQSATPIATQTTALERTSVQTILSGSPIELGPLMTGCYERRDLRITNDTKTLVEIRSAQRTANSDGSFLATYLRGNTAVTLTPGEEASLLIETYRGQSGLISGGIDLELSIDGLPQTQRLNFNTPAQDAQSVTDQFLQKPAQKVDILFVISRSASMRPLAANTRQNLKAALDVLARLSPVKDFRVGFLAMDSSDGELLAVGTTGATWISPSSQLDSQLVVDSVDLEPRPHATSSGLDALSQSLLRPDTFRNDAVLSLIFVAAEDDTSNRSVDGILNQLRSHWAPHKYIVSAITSDPDQGRPAPVRWAELTSRTGGIRTSIDNDEWSRFFDPALTVTFDFESRFVLSQPARPDSLQLVLASGPLPARQPGGALNWIYAGAYRAVDFAPLAVPAPAASFSIHYTPACPGLLDPRPL